jgi:hypothetical protein
MSRLSVPPSPHLFKILHIHEHICAHGCVFASSQIAQNKIVLPSIPQLLTNPLGTNLSIAYLRIFEYFCKFFLRVGAYHPAMRLQKPIPIETQRALWGLGIDPDSAREWSRLVPPSTVVTNRDGHRCDCGDAVGLFPANLDRRRVLLGQCKSCWRVYWKDRAW